MLILFLSGGVEVELSTAREYTLETVSAIVDGPEEIVLLRRFQQMGGVVRNTPRYVARRDVGC